MKTLITKLSPWMNWLCGIKPEVPAESPREPEPPPVPTATLPMSKANVAALLDAAVMEGIKEAAAAKLGVPVNQIAIVPVQVLQALQQGGVCVCERCRARRRVEQLMGHPCPN